MKKAFLFTFLMVFLNGCCSTEYYPATNKTFVPKDPNAPFDFLLDPAPVYPAEFIGRLVVSSNSPLISTEMLQSNFIKEAQKRGADGASGIYYKNIETLTVISGQTMYAPVSTHHSGTFTGRNDTVSFSGDSTTFVPVREPDKYIPCTTKVINGLLFVRTYP